MLYELIDDLDKILPIFEGHFQDPLMYAAIEGQRQGRVFVDDPASPKAAFVWPYSECTYLAGGQENQQSQAYLNRLVVSEIIPASLQAEPAFDRLRGTDEWLALLARAGQYPS